MKVKFSQFVSMVIAVILVPFLNPSAILAQPSQSSSHEYRASDILDKTVRNKQGEKLGELEDLIINRNRKIEEALLALGGFPKIRGKSVAIPFQELKIDEKGNLVCNATKAHLKSLREFDYARMGFEGGYYPRPNIPPYRPYGYYYGPRGPAYPPSGEYREEPERLGPQGENQPMDQPEFAKYIGVLFTPSYTLATFLMGAPAMSRRGEDLGDVKDLIINEEGQITGLVIGKGGFMGIHEKQARYPFSRLRLNQRGYLVLDFSTGSQTDGKGEKK